MDINSIRLMFYGTGYTKNSFEMNSNNLFPTKITHRCGVYKVNNHLGYLKTCKVLVASPSNSKNFQIIEKCIFAINVDAEGTK
jgi:hypothetical protein